MYPGPFVFSVVHYGVVIKNERIIELKLIGEKSSTIVDMDMRRRCLSKG